MKKYILFFISIGIILVGILIFNVMNVEESKKETFSESGYILNGSSSRYYFYQDETYTPLYNKQIAFYDTEGTKVTISNDNFVHYASGNIVALQQSVLLDLNKINDDPIVYYDIKANKEIKKVSSRYTVKNLDSDIQFEQAIWKISANKYIVLANKLNIMLNNGMTKEAEGYVEIEYSDNEIVNIYNQEFSYQTISSDSYIELQDGIKLNIGNKIVSQNDENKMSLEDMVINSNDNVTLVDLTKEDDSTKSDDENTDNEDKENGQNVNGTQPGGTNAGTSSSTETTTNTNSSNTTLIQNGTNSSNTTGDENKINIETPDILYEYVNDNESKVDETAPINEPKFKLENMKITAVGISGNIQITDDNDALSKNDDINVKIINNQSGKTVYTTSQSYGGFNIPLDVQTLVPDTSYTVVTSSTYIVNEKSYTKNFIYKMFTTTSSGVKISKDIIIDYIEYAKQSFLIFTIKNYFSKFVEKETTPKYYFNDNGLLNLFLNKEEPRLLENLVAINLWNNYKSNVYYLKSQNLDVDFFIEETGTAIQVAYSITNISDDRETKSLVEAAKTLKEAKEFVIITYEEEKELNMDGVKIQVIPVWKWLLKIKNS